MRLPLALNVRNMEEAVAYSSKLFGVQPHKERPGCANFAIDRPPQWCDRFFTKAGGRQERGDVL